MGANGFFDGNVAATYDQVHGGSNTEQVEKMVNLLAQLALDGAALELAVGTGRIALPLLERGVQVAGIELSKDMVAELRKKEVRTPMEVAIGDMTTTRVVGEFSLVYLVYNTIDNLTSQDEQISCFKNAFAHLKPGGRFLIETLVPPIQKIPFGETMLADDCSLDHWGIDEFDIVTQQYTSHHIRMTNDTFTRNSVPFRFAWPAEFDVMAKFAGFGLENRWSDWLKSPFTRLSKSHISIWQKPEA